ncbi:shikimate kinase [Luteolibacter algae]|uniref:Shikimate kinase n=1 Tax=Luteolibacter algae TaxID=454151 RepID=A0ABW5D9W5_9BACT
MNQTEVIPKNIVLIGFMGSGKSTVGRELHQRLGYSLTDMDQLIEETMGKKITEIFKEEGETAFRDFETLQLIEIAKQTESRHIVSTGGGIVIRPENRKLLRNLGYVVWLHAPGDVIYERTARNKDRPLLNLPNARERIDTLMAEREPWYCEAAHLKIDTAGLDSKEIATGILESARYFFTHPI